MFLWHQTESYLLENLQSQKGDFLLENLNIKKNSDDVQWNVWTNIKTLYARNNIFKKRIPNMIFWIIYIFVQMSFVGTALGRFSQCFFFNFLSPTIVADIFIHSQPPPSSHHEKASYGHGTMFKVNNKNINVVVLVFLLLTLKINTAFPSVSIVYFEQVNVSWIIGNFTKCSI